MEEPILILARDVRWLCSKEILIVKVQCRHLQLEEDTWEIEQDMDPVSTPVQAFRHILTL